MRVEGTPLQLPAGVDLSAYRIVQEALTNVVKHAGPARAQVMVGYGDQDVTSRSSTTVGAPCPRSATAGWAPATA